MVLLGGVVFGDGVMNVELAPTDQFALEMAHRVLGVANVEV